MTPMTNPYYLFPRPSRHIDLTGQWELTHSNSPLESPAVEIDRWELTTETPEVVHWALYRAGLHGHPYYRRNILDYTWLEQKTWYYRKRFSATIGEDFALLCFDGLDYFSKVWLNGVLLASHEGMFWGPMVDVTESLEAENELIVEVRAANYGRPGDAWDPRAGKGRVITPWGISKGTSAEEFMTVGMWRPARIELVAQVHIERPFVQTVEVAGDAATLRIQAEILCGTNSAHAALHPWKNGRLDTFWYEDDEWHRADPSLQTTEAWESNVTLAITVTGPDGSVVHESIRPIQAHRGRNFHQSELQVDAARLWWPVGMGEQPLYTVRLQVAEDGETRDTLEVKHGIRMLTTVPSGGPRNGERWRDWQFQVNGVPFFVKGINWMPADVLLHLPSSRYRWLLQMAKNAGIQMVRIWGAGLIENDDFYEICDELGILVWQDFSIANSDSPEWPIDIWEEQVAASIFRLRNHASLAVWCGGNEFNPYTTGNTAAIGTLERNVQLLDGTRMFIRTSPDEGSIHTYPDMDPTWYRKRFKDVPFIAETGIHSFPEARLIRELVDPAEIDGPISGVYDPAFKDDHPDFVHHFGEYQASRIPRMLSRASTVADIAAPTLEQLVEASQIGAGEFYQILSQEMQSNYPVTTGLLPWVYKRPWPVTAIQLVDGMGHAGAPYYFLKRTYEPIHACAVLPHLVWAPGDTMPLTGCVLALTPGAAAAPVENESTMLTLRVYGRELREIASRESRVPLLDAPAVYTVPAGEMVIPDDAIDSFLLVVTELHTVDGELLARSVLWPRCLSHMEDPDYRADYRGSPKPAIEHTEGPWLKDQIAATTAALTIGEMTSEDDSAGEETTIMVTMKNSGPAPAFPVHLDVAGRKRAFYASDNFFWLEPGESRRVALQVRWRDAAETTPRVRAAAWNAPAVEAALR